MFGIVRAFGAPDTAVHGVGVCEREELLERGDRGAPPPVVYAGSCFEYRDAPLERMSGDASVAVLADGDADVRAHDLDVRVRVRDGDADRLEAADDEAVRRRRQLRTVRAEMTRS